MMFVVWLGMEKELILNREKPPVLLVVDDLVYNGKNIVIPSYWTDLLLDLQIKENIPDEDRKDLKTFLDFLCEIQELKNSGN